MTNVLDCLRTQFSRKTAVALWTANVLVQIRVQKLGSSCELPKNVESVTPFLRHSVLICCDQQVHWLNNSVEGASCTHAA